MRYIVIEEFPEGDFNIPLLEDGSNAVFDDLEEAKDFVEELHNGYVLPLRNITDYSIISKDRIKKIYDHLDKILNANFYNKVTTRKREVVIIKDAVRYFLYEYCRLSYVHISELERAILGVKPPNHTTIMHSVKKVQSDPVFYRSIIKTIRTI